MPQLRRSRKRAARSGMPISDALPNQRCHPGVLGTMEQKTRVRVFSGHNSSQKLSFRLSAAIEEAVTKRE